MAKDQKQKRERRLHTSTLLLLGIAALVAVIVLDVSYISGWGKRDANRERIASTDVFATVDTTLLEGGTFTGENLKGAKITAFNVWETTCPACLGEMGALEELSQTYPSSDFQLVGVCTDVYDKDRELIQSQVEKGKMLMENAEVTFPNLIPTPEMYAFIRSTVVGYPTTFFVDEDGTIIASTCGAKELDAWKENVEEVMEGQK